MTVRIGLGFLLLFLLVANCFCWNSLGHKLVAQIAYNNLSDEAKTVYNSYNQALNGVYASKTLINAAPWLDGLRYQNKLWMQSIHYINIPFSYDNTELHPPNTVNAVNAIEKASQLLKSSQTSTYDKGFSLRILLHVVGDIHQPMHAVSLYSKRFPQGDKGGNFIRLAPNPIASNLHAYWDNGGGYLKVKPYYSNALLTKKAHEIESIWPCHPWKMKFNPLVWANESHTIAVNKAYKLKFGRKPTKSYQQMVNQITKKRIAIAGCRLASLLNENVHEEKST